MQATQRLTRPARPWLSSAMMGQLVSHAILLFMSLLAILPFIWMIFASFKTFRDLVSSKSMLPEVWTVNNYVEIASRVNFPVAFLNSTIAATVVTLATLLTSAALGFVFAKYHFWGKEKLFLLMLSTMMVPFAVIMVPLYLTVTGFGLANNLGGIIITGLWSSFGMFMLRQFMETIPVELIDAARIDGASEWRIFAQIVLPLSGAPLAALAIFSFLGNWDSYLWPLVVLSSPDKQTLPLILAGLRNLWWTRYEMWAAGSMLTVIPVMLIYSLASKYFIRGIAMTGLKA
ncbi:MAG: carbohydrate ABC transporter permease [Caldilineaceae bacterium]|nr:carbohydrate ABC transporter permease [Caldilineaceae bacterium]